ncbi:hypothetical protein JAK58_14560 [Stenotrophomonas maltophilia]|uniref:hypothetical protein n=1 Tax=Stenotrophomonas maltophilia TaxID=40324 RepID=UPI0021CA0FD1|nr:hypothetical protein [Stenotrophomonas maltophilia]MCU1092734.1 hypothetical protein [Stenotrophomonas maltophilia]
MRSLYKGLLAGGLGVVTAAVAGYVIIGSNTAGSGANVVKAAERNLTTAKFGQCQARLDGSYFGDDEDCREYFTAVAIKLKDDPELTAISGVPVANIRQVHADLNREKVKAGAPVYPDLPKAAVDQAHQ